MRFILLIAILVTSVTVSIAYAQSDLSKHNPDDVCKTAKNVQTQQKVTFCIDSNNKQKYIPQAAPVISTDGIFSASADNSTDFILMNNTSPITNMSIASMLGGKATHLIPLDITNVCQLNNDKKCSNVQNQFITQNLTTAKDSVGNWLIKGGVTYLGSLQVSKLAVNANFFDSKGVAIGGLVSEDLKTMHPGDTQQFTLKTVKSDTKIAPAFVVISYHGEQR